MNFSCCNICNSKLNKYKYIHGEESDSKVLMMKCSNCKMLFSKVGVYTIEGSSFSHNTFDGYLGSKEYTKIRVNSLIRSIEQNYLKKRADSSLIDIGCGIGWSLGEAKKLGYECYGIEPMKEAAEYGKNKLDVEIINNKFHSSIVDKPCDIVIMDQVLEHVSQPFLFMKDVVKILKPGGVLFLAVPPNDWLRRSLSLSLRLPYSIASYLKKFKSPLLDKISNLDLYKSPEGHINVFTIKSIAILAKKLDLDFCNQYHINENRNKLNKLLNLSSGSYILQKKNYSTEHSM